MTWARFHDGLHDDPGIVNLSHDAFRLYVVAITYSRQRQLAGVLDREHLEALLRLHCVKPKAAAELVKAKLWTALGSTGYAIRSYEKFNPLTAEEQARKQALPRGRARVRPPAIAPARAPAIAPARRARDGYSSRVPYPVLPRVSKEHSTTDPVSGLPTRVVGASELIELSNGETTTTGWWA